MTTLLKFCNKCKLTLDTNFFGKDKGTRDKLTTSCKKCRNKYNTEYRKNNPEFIKKINEANRERRKKYYSCPERKRKYKDRNLRYTFGISIEQYEEMLRLQNGKCKICGNLKGSNFHDYLSVDHCHKSGKIRGLLCGQCNVGLGSFRDNTKFLNLAINYLKENQ